MKNKILFIAPGYYGFNEVIGEALKKYSNSTVVSINSTLPYKYKNFRERLHNFFLKNFFGKNLKEIKKGLHIKQTVEQYAQFDLLIINRPDVLTLEDLDMLISACKRSVCLFWDSVDKIPQQKDFITYFDTVFSFDSHDCAKYGFQPITNFYFAKSNAKGKIKYDVALLLTYDKRISELLKLFQYFKDNGIKAKAKIFTYKSHPIKEKLPEGIEVINTIIPFKTAYEYYLDAKSILDLAHENQQGLSFRPFEAIGLEKKLITNARNIKEMNFYNEQNICIVEDLENIFIPKSFFETGYKTIDKGVKDQYFIKNWIENITRR